ncbi:UDP-N-acetylmuramoyl-tripeptide--D-alanyl-D-alanine ligase [Irregularibacter muris]|uniref:UDP-N-acetylmuramoyl-tripeptide--D-alanyl-D-alanine ligase n=1 Tax=Irregularibacter muris TaxID=1796619 RepID=A0AAE3HCN6_9FIRM|nr:UDP-N-acetylmuramoyl-tripeptide--D-alanyl-D-alanine ligase [Irregularibacter muris]MCR1898017.1 UDP-N-acetylmuramoyl-tripeptide--D-alanyl-D-alanine ligase [Irregularibacter muris]
MQKMTKNEIIRAVEGNLIHDAEGETISGICIDSRRVKKGDLFIAIKGENFDGHEFIHHAIESGASACIISDPNKRNKNADMILVENTLTALQKLAFHYRKKFTIPFIAITGSSGKTTTKDMIAAVLSQKYDVLKTQGNYNNEIGLPLTLFQLEPHHEIAVIEMGMSDLGEISTLVHMVYPDIAVITNIGLTHIENLGTQEKIFEAKKEILETLGTNHIALLNGDDQYLQGINSEKYRVAHIGIEGKKLGLKASNIIKDQKEVAFSVEEGRKNIGNFKLSLPGIHNIYNGLMAIYIGKHFNLSQQEIQQGLDRFKPSQMRMDIFKAGEIEVINDVYNANPDSMNAALQVLRDFNKSSRKIAILGDMLEMGDWSKKAHVEIGHYVSKMGIEVLLTLGEYSSYYIQGARNGGMPKNRTLAFSSNSEVIEYLTSFIENGDVFLVKGSRGLKMEKIVNFLQERS